VAKALGGEIINTDSVQVYKGLDVGAAKASLEEQQGVPHHLMDLVLPTVDYTYEQFLAESRAATEEILSKGKGMYMRWYMQNRQGITSHPFPSEDTEGLTDHLTEWDYDFQCYFLYQHRADLYPHVDIRCEQMIPELLKETSWLLDLGVRPSSNTAAKAIGYEEAMHLLLEARGNDGVVSEERFLSFLSDFQHNSKNLVRKQITWFRSSERSDVRKFRWVQAGQPVEHMVELLANEYRKAPGTPPSDFSSGEILKLASLKEQKRMKNYKPEFKVYSNPEAVTSALEWIRASQAPYASSLPNGIRISSLHDQPLQLQSKL
jgi:tRNA A37 N6-isopentenylltransferase MiaA